MLKRLVQCVSEKSFSILNKYIDIRKKRASNYCYLTRTNSLHSSTNIFRSNREPHQGMVILLHFITIFQKKEGTKKGTSKKLDK